MGLGPPPDPTPAGSGEGAAAGPGGARGRGGGGRWVQEELPTPLPKPLWRGDPAGGGSSGVSTGIVLYPLRSWCCPLRRLFPPRAPHTGRSERAGGRPGAGCYEIPFGNVLQQEWGLLFSWRTSASPLLYRALQLFLPGMRSCCCSELTLAFLAFHYSGRMCSPGWLDVPQALGRGNGTSWISAKCPGLCALHARVRQGPLP